jgi:hypothetical protein
VTTELLRNGTVQVGAGELGILGNCSTIIGVAVAVEEGREAILSPTIGRRQERLGRLVAFPDLASRWAVTVVSLSAWLIEERGVHPSKSARHAFLVAPAQGSPLRCSTLSKAH